jgi:hypothetical protein
MVWIRKLNNKRRAPKACALKYCKDRQPSRAEHSATSAHLQLRKQVQRVLWLVRCCHSDVGAG